MEVTLPSTSSVERIGQLIHEMMGVIIQRSACEMLTTITEAGISMPQLVALSMLNRHGPHSISAIAARLNLSLAATSHLVDRMVKQELVVRGEDAEDRRHKRVVITPAGMALLERLVQARVREIAQTMAGIPPELRDQFETVLAEVVEQLKQQGE
jgi:DNA-binding MarR family transcriptional regulator